MTGIKLGSQKLVHASMRRELNRLLFPRKKLAADYLEGVPTSELPGYKTLADVPGTIWYLGEQLNIVSNPDAGRIVVTRSGNERGE